VMDESGRRLQLIPKGFDHFGKGDRT
jgi:hypothetical protein